LIFIFILSATPAAQHYQQLCQCALFFLYAQRFEAGDDIEQILVDAALAQAVGTMPIK
jgi:hypothetical protein